MKKKHLGQHFLHDPKLLHKIAGASPAQPGDLVLEIGPGDGALTRAILDKECTVVAVEYDAELIPELKARFPAEIAHEQLRLVQADFLEIDIADLLINRHLEEPRDSVASHANNEVPRQARNDGERYHVIANIPYYITGAILRKLLSGECQPESCTLIMQREVAERIVCRDGKQSLLSLSVAVYGQPNLEFRIPAGAFNPPPNVDSALLTVSSISRNSFKSRQHEDVFFELIHAGFSQKRKQLYKLIAYRVSRDVFYNWCAENTFSHEIRAEDVSLAAWLGLALCILSAQKDRA